MTYPYVAAANDYGLRKGPVLGFVVHMAEGGNTVRYLAGTPNRGVSVHYVIEYTGRIVQMLSESHASGSINPTEIRTTDDPDGFYGVTANKAVMGDWWRDPNSAVISVEIEGFASAGPNTLQNGALQSLVADVRTRYPLIGLLGHRDFQSVKACPGKLIHWSEFGGHGPAQEAPVQSFTVDPVTVKTGTLTLNGPGHYYLRAADGTGHGPIDNQSPSWVNRPAFGPVNLLEPWVGETSVYVVGTEAAYIRAVDCTFTPDGTDCADAVAAEHERTRQAAIAAVEAIA